MATPSNGPVETKVAVATVTAAIVSLIMALLMKSFPVLAPLSDAVEAIILAAVTSAFTFGVAWFAKHTNRNDAGTRQTGTSDPIPPTS